MTANPLDESLDSIRQNVLTLASACVGYAVSNVTLTSERDAARLSLQKETEDNNRLRRALDHALHCCIPSDKDRADVQALAQGGTVHDD